jgi:hypothetical protein
VGEPGRGPGLPHAPVALFLTLVGGEIRRQKYQFRCHVTVQMFVAGMPYGAEPAPADLFDESVPFCDQLPGRLGHKEDDIRFHPAITLA